MNILVLALVSFVIVSIAIGGMAVGVIFNREPLAGSCGGLKKLFGSGDCDICENRSKCEKKKKAAA